ncbi:MAG: rhomboid family intramembrane serine protease [Sedimentisphaerales bacterium]|nr:rhomboid family intramembrane serine protease [Sedimentisphaerales bacterium]
MMNWLVIVATVAVFWLQISDAIRQEEARPHGRPGPIRPPVERPYPGRSIDPNALAPLLTQEAPTTITDTLMLRGWGIKGLFGYMWLHGGLFHLLGNMWFLWIFGNAVCAKVGNVRYLLLYVSLGVAAGVAHLLTSSGSAIGASGAINGVVGMYLVLFPENAITCYWSPIIIYWRQFTVSSMWMILFWLFWDIVGAFFLGAGSSTAYFAHLGGFAAGFGVAFLMCKKGWIAMERYEKSILQMWQERKKRHAKPPFDPTYSQLGLQSVPEELHQEEPIPVPAASSKRVPCLDLDSGKPISTDNLMRATCSCGRAVTVSRQYAGKVVQCPVCKGKIVVPESIEPTRSAARLAALGGNDGYIRFACPCGKRIKMPARYAGRWGKCPQCGSRVRIPQGP